MKPAALILAGTLALSGSAGTVDFTVRLAADTSVANAGFYQLRWEEGGAALRLVESDDASFSAQRIVYEGADTARLVSGKPDGDYYYRLESSGARTEAPVGIVSNTVRVTVEHHSLRRAVAFFAVGAVVFAATLGLIVFGRRAEFDD